MDDQLTLTLSNFKGGLQERIKLTQLFVTHVGGGIKKSKDMVDKLVGGEKISVSIPREDQNTFLQGLQQQQLTYKLEE